MYYIIPYRKSLIKKNLRIAFPDKSEKEINKIVKKFYTQFCDGFLEIIKMYGSKREKILARCSGNPEVLQKLVDKGIKNIQMHSGHQFNWEWANWYIGANVTQQIIGIYTEITNKTLDKIFYELRSRYGAELIVGHLFNQKKDEILNKPYLLGQIADQKPSHAINGYWLNFFNTPTAFIGGPDRGARNKNAAVVFVRFERVKRGFYNYYFELATENAFNWEDGELTRAYARFLEDALRKDPVNYLWSHNRWKWQWQENFKWVDNEPPKLN